MSKLKIKDLNTVANVYEIPTVGTGATITGSLEGDVIVIDSNSTKFTVKASGSKLTISGINDFGKKFSVTVTFDKSKAAVAQTAKIVFADGAVDFAYNPATKILSSNGTPVGKTAVGVSTLSVDSAINADSFDGANDGTPAPVLGKTLTLTSGVDRGDDFVGSDGNDVYDARIVPGTFRVETFDQFDELNGGAGIGDKIITDASLDDIDFTNVKNIEIASTAANVALGAIAAAAGINQVEFAGAAGDANLVGFNAAVAVKGNAGANTVTVSAADAGTKTLNLGTGVDTVNVNSTGAAASSVVRFVSGSVGNNTNDMAKITSAGGDVLVNDEGTVLVGQVADQFNVRGTDAAFVDVAGQDRGNFQTVVLGTNAADTDTTDGRAGNVYINAGAGADDLTAIAAAGQRHFLVGGGDNDKLTIGTVAGGTVVAIAGDGDDAVVVNTGSTGVESINLASMTSPGTNTVTYTGTGLNLNVDGGDTLTGGAARDTLIATSNALTTQPASTLVGGISTQTMTAFEALTVSDAQTATTLVTKSLQAGIDTVTLNGTGIAASTITFDNTDATLNLGAVASGNIAVISGAGTSDKVTIKNTAAAGGDILAGRSITATAVETLVVNTSAAGVAAAQTYGAVSNVGNTIQFVGSNTAGTNLTVLNAATVNASGLTGTAALNGTIVTVGSLIGSSNGDNITIAGNSTATVNTGAGNDFVNISSLNTAGNSIDSILNGGDGVDRLVMTAANAAAATAPNTPISTKLTSFEELQIGQVAMGASNTIDLRFLGLIEKVVSFGTAAPTAVAVAEVQTLTVTYPSGAAGIIAAFNTGTITLDISGTMITLQKPVGTAADTANAIAAAINSALTEIVGFSNIVSAASARGAVVTVTYNAARGEELDMAFTAPAGITATVAETVADAPATPAVSLNVLNLTNDGTFELTGALAATTAVSVRDADIRTSDSIKIKLNGVAQLANTATLTLANIETINIESTYSGAIAPVVASDLRLNSNLVEGAAAVSNVAKKVVVTGNNGVNLTNSNLINVTDFDASAVTAGAVTFAAQTGLAATLKGGAGNDVLTAVFGTTVKTIDGGAGNDTITTRAGNDIVSGGSGDDLIVTGAGDDAISAGEGVDVITAGAGKDAVNLTETVAARDTLNVLVNGESARNNFDVITGFGIDSDAVAGLNANADIFTFGTGLLTATSGVSNGVVSGDLKTAVDASSSLVAAIQLIEQEFFKDNAIANTGTFAFEYKGSTYVAESTGANGSETIADVVQLVGVTGGTQLISAGGNVFGLSV